MIRIEDKPSGLEGIRVLTLDVPKRRNAISVAMAKELASEIARASASSDVRVLVLTGEGSAAFCAGLDLNELQGVDFAKAEEIADAFSQFFLAIHNLQKPLIVAVNGSAVGAGLGLILEGDLAVLSETAYLGTPEIRHGIVPVLILQAMYEKMPFKVANRLLLLGEKLNAKEALSLNIVNEVVPSNQVLIRTLEIATQIAGYSETALSKIKNVRRSLMAAEGESAIAYMKYELRDILLPQGNV
jgi:enoyl-CoA hydratase/carnithine racemase